MGVIALAGIISGCGVSRDAALTCLDACGQDSLRYIEEPDNRVICTCDDRKINFKHIPDHIKQGD